MSARKHISRNTQLAAALREVLGIPHEHAKKMHEDQLISLGELHHIKRYENEPDNHHSNLDWMLRSVHREQTAKIDIPEIAKGKRITQAEFEHKMRLVTKTLPDLVEGVVATLSRGRKMGSRPFPKGRKMRR